MRCCADHGYCCPHCFEPTLLMSHPCLVVGHTKLEAYSSNDSHTIMNAACLMQHLFFHRRRCLESPPIPVCATDPPCQARPHGKSSPRVFFLSFDDHWAPYITPSPLLTLAETGPTQHGGDQMTDVLAMHRVYMNPHATLLSFKGLASPTPQPAAYQQMCLGVVANYLTSFTFIEYIQCDAPTMPSQRGAQKG